MIQQIIITKFVGPDNLEFVISNTDSKISKVLYRSFGNNKEFKEKIFDYISENKLLKEDIYESVFEIFHLKMLEDTMFHFAIDRHTQRYKFYISLYHHSFQDSLKIITKIKEKLDIKGEYFLEKNFVSFDCIGFDIKNGGIEMKVYELLSQDTSGYDIPDYVKNNTKELGVLKDMKTRKKYFYRLKTPLSMAHFIDSFDISGIKTLQGIIPEYTIHKHVRYYCQEGEKEEIYFI